MVLEEKQIVNYYNEFDPDTAAWLRELIKRGLIPNGDVDERSITDVQGANLTGYDQCHFFAGIAGWSLALQYAGWPRDRPVWTGSCPCQPFSVAGKKKAQEDERHLWPAFHRLISECRPPVVFGEQVEGAIRHGWLDGVQADLEAEGYSVGAHVLGAHSVGSPQVRQRLYWVANTLSSGRQGFKHDDSLLSRESQAHSESLHGFSIVRDALAEPSSFIRTDDGLSVSMARRCVHGYGNAIVPQVAAKFIGAYMETRK